MPTCFGGHFSVSSKTHQIRTKLLSRVRTLIACRDGFSNEWIFPSVSGQAKHFLLETKMTLWASQLLVWSATLQGDDLNDIISPAGDKSSGFNYAFICGGAASRHGPCLFTLCDLLVKAVCYVLITHSLHAGVSDATITAPGEETRRLTRPFNSRPPRVTRFSSLSFSA